VLPSAASLSELIQACNLGVRKYTQIPTADIFNERLDKLIATRFNRCDRQGINIIGTEGYSGLLSARTRAEDSARTHFAAGQRLLSRLRMSSDARKLAESMFFAQKAYQLYVRRRFSDAIRMLQRSFVNDRALEVEPGFEILAMHRIQLLNNWMRVEVQRGNWQQGFALGIRQLQYLEAPEAKIFRSLPAPWNRGWNRQLSNIPEDLISKMHAQIAAETISLFQDVITAQTSSSEISRVILRAARLTSAETQIGRWLDFQFARFNRTVDECCFAASAVLRHGSVPSSPLWLSIARYIATLLNAANRDD
jgi:hypothetical protein